MRRIIITSITIGALMLSTAVLYLIAASQDYIGVAESLSSSASSQINSRDRLADIMGTTNEMIFFMIVGVVYIPVGFWIVKRKHQSKVPYILAIIGSATLIVFYIATRIVSIPTIGLQTDVGSIDIAVKVLQSAIIVGSLFALGLPKKFTIIAR